MKNFSCAAALLLLFVTPVSAQTGYDGPPAMRPPTGSATVIPWEALDRLGAVHTEPYQASPAVISMFLVCRIVSVGGDFGDEPVEFETCDPVLVWCPKRGEACTTID